MKWTLAKVLGLIGVILCVLLLVAVGARLITWKLFWIGIILIAGFAYFILPKLRKED